MFSKEITKIIKDKNEVIIRKESLCIFWSPRRSAHAQIPLSMATLCRSVLTAFHTTAPTHTVAVILKSTHKSKSKLTVPALLSHFCFSLHIFISQSCLRSHLPWPLVLCWMPWLSANQYGSPLSTTRCSLSPICFFSYNIPSSPQTWAGEQEPCLVPSHGMEWLLTEQASYLKD